MSDAKTPSVSRRALIGAGAVTAIAAASAGWFFWSRPSFAGSALTPQQAYQAAKQGEIVLVDIRTPEEWKRTGVPDGAYPIDMRRRDFIQRLDEITGSDRSASIAFICATGARSARLSQILTDAGYSRIINVPEGMMGSRAGPGWLRSKLPVRQFSG